MLFLKKIPFQFTQSIEKRVVIFCLEVAVVSIGYFMITYYKVFNKLINRLVGVLFIWPIVGFALILFNVENSLISALLFVIGGSGISVAIYIIHSLKDATVEDMLVAPKSGDFLFKPKLVLKGVIMWFIFALILLIILSRV
jgi:4-hydroxybenzoate polyprenyltransferase